MRSRIGRVAITFQYRVNERYVGYVTYLVTDRQTDKYHKTKHFAGEMYSKIRVKWAAAHFFRGLTSIHPLLTKICAKNEFFIFVPSDLDLRTTFRPQICSPSYSCTGSCLPKIRIFYGFPVLRKSEAPGRKDRLSDGRRDERGATLNAAP